MEDLDYSNWKHEWFWYIHIGDISYREKYRCWVFRDLFCDVVVKKDCREHSVLDLDELAEVFEMRLISQSELIKSLQSMQELVNLIMNGGFPPKEVIDCKSKIKRLGW